jgi:carboxymethylenebutenolidase
MKPARLVALVLACTSLCTFVLSLRADAPADAKAGNGVSGIAPFEAEAKDRLNKSPRHGEWVEVPLADGKKMRSYIVYPERSDKAPVVLVIMEIFGMSDWVRATTDQLAADGFIAIAPDFLSGKGKDGGDVSPDDARNMVSKLSTDEVMTKLNATRDYALKLPAANGKTACIGFCWGGGMSFSYAATQPDLNGAAVFYGTPPKDDQHARIKCPVAGFYGGKDMRVTATVEKTTDAMKKLGKKYEPHVFEGAGHGFMRAHAPKDSEANQKAATEAWPMVVQFLKDCTK